MLYNRFTRSWAGHGMQHPNRQKAAFSVSVVPFLAFGSRMKGEGHSASTKPGGTAARWRPAWSLVTIEENQVRKGVVVHTSFYIGTLLSAQWHCCQNACLLTCRVEIITTLIRLKSRISDRRFCIAIGNKWHLSCQGENVATCFVDFKTRRCASHPHFLLYGWCK